MAIKDLKNLFFLAIALIVVSPASFVAERKDLADVRVVSVLKTAAQGLDERTRTEVAQTVSEAAQTYRIDPMLILAVMKVESTFDPKAISNAQAYGLMQVRKIVVKDVAAELGISPRDGDRLLSSHAFNIRVGVHYLSKLLIMFRGDVKKALMAYNAGPTSVARLYNNRPAPEGGYQGRVLKAYWIFSNS